MELNIGIVGAGNFARFAAEVFLNIPGIKIVAVTDVDEATVTKMSAEWNATAYNTFEDFLEDSNIELVYIATPPWLHYEQSKNALLKGKHVICEKPAALSLEEAKELAALANTRSLLWVVNLMQRYNPLYQAVDKIVKENLLGSFLHGFFENYASDENLVPNHWFWQKEKSGGIFIEHAVHFFDMFAGWLGEGKLLHAYCLKRPAVPDIIIDRVQATVQYEAGVVNFYHGFDQPDILDRQEMRLQFERGEITLYEWVPVRMRLHGLLQKKDVERLKYLMAGYAVMQKNEDKWSGSVRGRSKEISFDVHATFEYNDVIGKKKRYQKLLNDMMIDQWQWIGNRNHIRLVDENNAVQSLQMAAAATGNAQII